MSMLCIPPWLMPWPPIMVWPSPCIAPPCIWAAEIPGVISKNAAKMIIIVRINLPPMKSYCFKDKEKEIPVKGVACLSLLRNVLPLHLEVPLPQQVDRRVDKELQKKRGNHPANHGGGDAFHGFGTGAGAPHEGGQTHQNSQHRHELGPQALHRTFHDRVFRVPVSEEPPLFCRPMVGDVQVEEHHHPGF